MTFSVILHRQLLHRLQRFCKRYPKDRPALEKAFEKLLADPFRAGGHMKGLRQPELQGRVYKLHVGGRSRYRMIYYIHPPTPNSNMTQVIPLFFSEVPRSRFDYDAVDPDALGQSVLSDIQANNVGSFVRYTGPAVLDTLT